MLGEERQREYKELVQDKVCAFFFSFSFSFSFLLFVCPASFVHSYCGGVCRFDVLQYNVMYITCTLSAFDPIL